MYPYILLNKKIEIYPLFWNKYNKISYAFMSDDSEFIKNLKQDEIKNQKKLNEKIFSITTENDNTIIYSWYLEKRLRFIWVLWHTQMVREERYYHLGIDLSVEKWTPIYCPLNWEIYDFWYEEWDWNYGWYIILKHTINWVIFYSLYWHLSYKNISVKKWTTIKSWTIMWLIWDYNENWWYFHHLHFQIISEKWKEFWFFSKWYCTKEQLIHIEEYTPNPLYLFRY